MRFIVAALVASALVTALVVKHPEVVLESCSLAIVLVLVWLERRHAAYSTRSAALHSLVEELETNVERLYKGLWERSSERVIAESKNRQRGLRYYYEHMAVGATQAALLNGSLGRRKDFALVQQLHHWERTATESNTRLAMAELHLFFLKADADGMLERLRIHASIASKPVVQQRKELVTALAVLAEYAAEDRLPRRLMTPVAEMIETARVSTEQIERTTDELWAYLRRESSVQQ
jgi:hypothetical protein